MSESPDIASSVRTSRSVGGSAAGALRSFSVTDQSPAAQPLPRRRPPQDGGTGGNAGLGLPRRTAAVRRVGRHRSLHRISVASDAPALVIAIPGQAGDLVAELADHIAEGASESCPGVDIRIGYLSGSEDNLAGALAWGPGDGAATSPQAVVVPLLAGPHPAF